MQCPQCGSEMHEEGDTMKCSSCGNVQEKNGQVPSDRPEAGEGEGEVQQG